MKSWSYCQITESMADQIRRSMDLARRESDHYLKNSYHAFAVGAFLAWNSLTMGWQNEGDYERLEALTKDESTDQC